MRTGAFTPGCQAHHIPPYIEKLEQLRAKGVDIVAVIAFNDAWVMSAWGKVNGVEKEDIVRCTPSKGCAHVRPLTDSGRITKSEDWLRTSTLRPDWVCEL